MQELIYFLNELNSDKTKPAVLERRLLQVWCETKLLEKEKEQIIKAQENWQNYFKDDVVSGISYYNRTFFQSKIKKTKEIHQSLKRRKFVNEEIQNIKEAIDRLSKIVTTFENEKKVLDFELYTWDIVSKEPKT